MDRLKEDLLKKTPDNKKDDISKLYENYKRKTHEANLIWFKIQLSIEDLSNLYYCDLPVSLKVMNTLSRSTTCKNLLEFWTEGSSGIRLMLSEHGIHKDLPIIMKSVDRMIELIDQYSTIYKDKTDEST